MKRVILLADDSPTIQRLVTQTFQGAQYDVVSVSNGDAAIRKFEEIHPDLIFADIYMPGRNGYEVCAYVKKHSQSGQTPVVLLAGAFDAFDEETAYQVGAATHVTKPFEPHALVALVESLLSGERDKQQPASSTQTVPETAVPLPEEVAKEITREVEEPAKAVGPIALAPQAPAPPPAPEPVPSPTAPDGTIAEATGDLLGLQDLFKPPAGEARSPVVLSDEEIDRIADRVMQKISTQVIESVAWDVVPDIMTKVLREELKRQS